MQAQTHVLAYRKDLFDKNGLTPPTTFEEMRTAAKKLQDAEGGLTARETSHRPRLRHLVLAPARASCERWGWERGVAVIEAGWSAASCGPRGTVAGTGSRAPVQLAPERH